MTPRVRHAPRACRRCGESFTPRRRDADFCGGACRVAAHRERRRVRALGQGTNGLGRLADYAAASGLSLADTRHAVHELIRGRYQELERQRLVADRQLYAYEKAAP